MSSFYGETQAFVSLGGSGFFLHQEVEGETHRALDGSLGAVQTTEHVIQ